MEMLTLRIQNKSMWKRQLTKKELWENLHSTRQCEEKLLSNSVALIKEMLENHEVKEVKWEETSRMLADVLTKRTGNGSWIIDVISRNTI